MTTYTTTTYSNYLGELIIKLSQKDRIRNLISLILRGEVRLATNRDNLNEFAKELSNRLYKSQQVLG